MSQFFSPTNWITTMRRKSAGNPTKKIEAEGVKTVIITDEYAGRDGKSQSLADSDPAADAVVTGGNVKSGST